MALIQLSITNKRTTLDAVNDLRAYGGDARQVLERLSGLMGGLAEGSEGQSMSLYVDGRDAAAASGTLTLTSVVATNTAQVGTQTFTASASPSGPNQFLVGISDAATALNLAAAISANPSLASVVSASALSNVVTVVAAHKGNAGNMIALVGSANIAASAAHLSGGSEATPNVYALGGLK